ncbi:unnamed protein product, partial [Ectocarpus sp. 13 AM-2016]
LKSKAARIGAGFVDTCLHYLQVSVSRIRSLRGRAADAAAPAPLPAASSSEEDTAVAVADSGRLREGASGSRIGSRHFRRRSSSLPPEKGSTRQGRMMGGASSRSTSVEGRDVTRAKQLEAEHHGSVVVGSGRGSAAAAAAAASPQAQIASLHRRAGRCILLLAKFVTRIKEEENGAASGTTTVRVSVEVGPDRVPVLDVCLPLSTVLGDLRCEVARRFRVPVEFLELARVIRRKGNTTTEVLDQDGASLEALGLAVAGTGSNLPNHLPTASPSKTSAPVADVAATTTTVNSSFSSSSSPSPGSNNASAGATNAPPPGVELLARMIGEPSFRGDQASGGSNGNSSKAPRKDDRVSSST